MTNEQKSDKFPLILSTALIFSVIAAISSYYLNISLSKETYSFLKSIFFIPLKTWIYPVIAASMFSIFFRSPSGKARKFFILLIDILLLYVLSTFIANIYAFLTFPLFPFVEAIEPLIDDNTKTVIFDKKSPGGLPTVIWVIIIGIALSFIIRYFFLKPFSLVAKILSSIFIKICDVLGLGSKQIVKELKSDYETSSHEHPQIRYCLTLINFLEGVIFKVLMLILLIAPFAVFASFLEMLNSRGIGFFSDLGKFIGSYAAILFSYQFLIMPLVRKIFCIGVGRETYKSFLTKALPVMATAGTTASSVATLATNVKAAQSLDVDDDMKGRGHNRALMPIGATFNMDGTSLSLVVYFLLAAKLAGMTVSFWWVVLTAVTLSVGTAAVPSASLIMLTSMYSAFSIPGAITGKLLSIIIAVDPIHDRIRTIVNTWGDLNMVYIVQCKRGIATLVGKLFTKKDAK